MMKTKLKNLLLSCILILSSINATALNNNQIILCTNTAAKNGFILSGFTLIAMVVTYGMKCTLHKDHNNFQENGNCKNLEIYSLIPFIFTVFSFLFLAHDLCSRGVNFYPSTTDNIEEEATP